MTRKKKREFSALHSLDRRYELKNCLVISKDAEETAEYKGTQIKILPAWKWVLEKHN